MNDVKINIGDLVYVVDTGSSYTTYKGMAKKLNVTNWDKGNLPNTEQLYIVKAGHEHLSYEGTHIFWIQSKDTGKGYLIGSKGIKVSTFNSNIFFSEEDFKI